MRAGIKEITHEAIIALLFRDRRRWRDVMGMLWAEGVVAGSGSVDVRVSCCESMVKGELNGGRGGAAVPTREGAFVERGWFAVWADDRLPVASVSSKEVEGILPVAKELGFGCDEGGGRERENNVLLLLQ